MDEQINKNKNYGDSVMPRIQTGCCSSDFIVVDCDGSVVLIDKKYGRSQKNLDETSL